MTKFKRIREILIGIIMMAAAVLIVCYPKEGYTFILGVLSTVFIIRGISNLIYYFRMARYMVEGKRSLYMGVMMLDFGIMTGTLTDVPHYYILLYLVGINAFAGAVDILRALEAKRYGARSWKLKICQGIGNLILALACLVFIRYSNTAVIIYAIGLFFSAIMRIITACRKTKLIYIQ